MASYRCAARDYRPILRRCKELGCTIRLTAKNHIAVRTPSGKTVFTAGTPSRQGSVTLFRSELRRAGVGV